LFIYFTSVLAVAPARTEGKEINKAIVKAEKGMETGYLLRFKYFNPMEYTVYLIRKKQDWYIQFQLDSLRA